ncbi:hypothetical protein [Amycolatopsis nigrescens]|uniref:hypothetical protein n=1 Tax=Amycolatopsis nigrescens TaxID=381445 RepID=UPI00036B24B7|nr:hypothetical protein [Amycolatopsis nigrescens]
MSEKTALSGPRGITILGLLVGAAGIAVLWAAGVAFPFYPPPGIIILLIGAVFMALSKARWAPAVGAFMGLFVVVGFLVSPDGFPNLTGEHGTGASIGSVIQLIGVVTALVAGVLATVRATKSRPAEHSS